MLTARQARVMRTVQDMVANGGNPTIRAISETLGYRSPGTVHKMTEKLVERGYLARTPSNGRLVVLRTIEEESSGEPASGDPIVQFIHRHQLENDGATPTRRAIGDHIGIRSMSDLAGRMTALIEDGAIQVMPSGANRQGAGAIRVTKKAR